MRDKYASGPWHTFFYAREESDSNNIEKLYVNVWGDVSAIYCYVSYAKLNGLW